MDIDFGSILFYTICGAFCILMAKHATIKPKRSFWLIVITLSLVAGLRKYTVGVDTEAYFKVFEALKHGYKESYNNIQEQGFLTLAYIVMQLTASPACVFLVIAFITNYFIMRRLFEERENISLPIAVFMYFSQYYFMTLNTIRQWIALAIVFYFSKYIGESKRGNIKFCIAVAVAVTMHYSAIVALACLVGYYLLVKSKKTSTVLTKLVIVVASPFVTLWLYNQLFDAYGVTYGTQTEGDLSWINVARILFLLALFVLKSSAAVNQQGKNIQIVHSDQKVSTERYQMLLYIAGIAITLLTAIYSYADRAGQYFILFELLVLPRYAKEKWSKQLTIIFVIVIFSYFRFRSFATNGYEELPYLPFWD